MTGTDRTVSQNNWKWYKSIIKWQNLTGDYDRMTETDRAKSYAKPTPSSVLVILTYIIRTSSRSVTMTSQLHSVGKQPTVHMKPRKPSWASETETKTTSSEIWDFLKAPRHEGGKAPRILDFGQSSYKLQSLDPIRKSRACLDANFPSSVPSESSPPN